MPNTELWTEIGKLELKAGDILLIRVPKEVDYELNAQIRNVLEPIVASTGVENVQILCLANTCDLQRLSEMTMNRLGWYRR
jgi:hypothetical protein